MSDENNILIADFIGMQKTNIGWYDSEEVLNFQLNGNTHDELWFEKSWDWLIPVIELCRDRQYFGSQRLISNIDKSLLKLDLIATYRNTVDFIKEYNQYLKI